MSDELPDPRTGVRASECPACGHPLNAATGIDDPSARPSPGDVSICWECAAVLAFTEDLSVRLMSNAEVAELSRDDPALYDTVQRARGDARR
jgi:hypothetical protein